MRPRLVQLCALLLASSLVALAGCSDDDDILDPPAGGAADIDVTASTPATGDTNISGSNVTVSRTTFVGDGTGGFTLGVNYTRVRVDANTGGYVRRVVVHFETTATTLNSVSYSWGVTDTNDNVVHCPVAGCAGVTIDTVDREIGFSGTVLDDSAPPAAPAKFATLGPGLVEYN